MDLLQDLDLSKKSSSPFSEPSKSNLHRRQTDRQTGETDKETDRGTEGKAKREARGRLGQQGSLGDSQEFITKAVIRLHNKARLHQKHTAFICSGAHKHQRAVYTPFLDAQAFLPPPAP